MTADSTILVTGATGKVGRNVVTQLLDAGVSVRALTRHPDAAGLPAGASVVEGDLSAPETFAGSLEGVSAAFLVWPFLTADAAPGVLEALVKNRVRRVVYLSASGVRRERARQSDPITQFHADLERLIEDAGLDGPDGPEWTFLRAGGFASNDLGWAVQIHEEGVVRAPFGDAGRSVIHERDIAAVAAHTLTHPDHRGKTYVLTGPETLTTRERVRIVGGAIGRSLRFEEISSEDARAQYLADGWPVSVVDGMLHAHAEMVTAPEQVTSAVEDLTGAPALTYRQWAIDHADDFR
ncbi:NAD(P)H-binding protein [Actinopolymorpha sp. B17G11]|uniref:NAD(P)H-binding protein n=1 Tax=Actinopolymorpha sp. B17G11 TaxID=3160861 RepID=UPI0032E40DF5